MDIIMNMFGKQKYYDNLYGEISIPKKCKKIIETDVFQRLGCIRQTGTVRFMLKCGEHTRYEHSIGVMWITGEFYNALIANSDIIYTKYISTNAKLLLQIAGLLHDIGHIAYSHLSEEVLNTSGVKFHHEEHSINILKSLKDHIRLSNKEIEVISLMISGIKYCDMQSHYDRLNLNPIKYPPFLFQIVANKDSGLDTDKMDYIRRDMYHFSMRVPDIEIPEMKISKNGSIIYSHKSLENIKNIFNLRKELYDNIYWNMDVLKLDAVIACAIKEFMLDVNDPEKLLKFTDYTLEKFIHDTNHHSVNLFKNGLPGITRCHKCPDIVLKENASLSSDSEDPIGEIIFY